MKFLQVSFLLTSLFALGQCDNLRGGDEVRIFFKNLSSGASVSESSCLSFPFSFYQLTRDLQGDPPAYGTTPCDDPGFAASCPDGTILEVTCDCDGGVRFFLPDNKGGFFPKLSKGIPCTIANPNNGQSIDLTPFTQAADIEVSADGTSSDIKLRGNNIALVAFEGTTGPPGFPTDLPTVLFHTGLVEATLDFTTGSITYTKLAGTSVYPCDSLL